MKKVTITKIHFGPYIKWAVVAYFLYGALAGLSEAIMGYLWTGENISGYFFWYALVTPLVTLAVGLIAGGVFIFLYNNFNLEVGSYVIEVDESTFDDHDPPPPGELFESAG